MTKVSVTPVTYEVGGREFDNQKEADAWAAMLDAKEKFENARDHLARKLSETYRTAEGKLFEWKLFTEYYRVKDEYGLRMPTLETVEIPYYTTSFDFAEHDGELEIRVYKRQPEESRWARLWEVQEFKVSELYRSKERAAEAVYKAQEAYLVRETQRIKEGREKIAEGRRDYSF